MVILNALHNSPTPFEINFDPPPLPWQAGDNNAHVQSAATDPGDADKPITQANVKVVDAGAGAMVVTDVFFEDVDGNTLVALHNLSISVDDFLDGATQTSLADLYTFWTSLFVGDLAVQGGDANDSFLEVGVTGIGSVAGGGGNDTLYVWHDKTVDFDGGDGVDTIAFESQQGATPASVSDLTVNLTNHTASANPFGGGGTLTLTHVENVLGVFGRNNDLTSDGEANFLRGGTAVDHLRGEGGNDTIYVKYWASTNLRPMLADGGTGNDKLVVEMSNAHFVGTGSNIIFINTLDLLDPTQDRGTFYGGSFVGFEVFEASADLIYQRFDFRGSNAGETASGSLGPDLLNGRGGNDILKGFGREDSLVGGNGNDVLSGGDGNDALSGGIGNDTVTGGTGRDQLAGGSEIDKFDFNAVGESVVGANRDIIADFKVAQHDKIDLSTIDADQRAGHAGNQKFVFIGADTFAHYHALHHAVFGMVRSAGGVVQANVNANLAADFEIKVNLPALHAGDFIL